MWCTTSYPGLQLCAHLDQSTYQDSFTSYQFTKQLTLQPRKIFQKKWKGLRAEQSSEPGGKLKPWPPAQLPWPHEEATEQNWFTKLSKKVLKSASESKLLRCILSPYHSTSKTGTFSATIFLQLASCLPSKWNSRCPSEER